MAVSIDGAGSVTGLDAVDVPVYADATARDAAIASPTAGQGMTYDPVLDQFVLPTIEGSGE